MPSVDNRVVQMQFENAAFDKKVMETMASLDKLNQKLQFTEVSKDLGRSLTDSLKNFNTDAVTSGIENVSSRFVALKTVAFTVVSEITRVFTDLGKKLATQMLRPDAFIQGFQEYELKMSSIQTIMASSGASLEVVNQKLQELNEYSDKTIYSFADMTENIGKFTNAGVSLDDSVKAIQGVANVAAVSGANANEAARSMYNFAQALSKGYVQLVDWKSIELANMGTVEFKQQLIDAAVALGELNAQGDGWVTKQGTFVSATKGFNESLTDAWLTTDVLTDTLGKYADSTTEIGKKAFAAAQDIKTFTQLMSTMKESIGSGWSQSFEIVIGNFEEAKGLFSFLGEAIGGFVNQMSDARNSLLTGWKDLGGRTALIFGIIEAFRALGDILKTVREAFRKVFPPMTSQQLYDLTKAFYDLTQRMKPSEETLVALRSLFTGLFSVMKVVVEVGKGLIRFLGSLFGMMAGGGDGIIAFVGKFGEFLTAMSEAIMNGDRINKFFSDLIDAFGKARDAIQPFLDILRDVVTFVGGFAGGVFDALLDGFSSLPDALGKIFSIFGEFSKKVGEAWNNIFSDVGKGDGSGDGLGFFDTLTGRVQERFGGLAESFANGVQTVVDALAKVGSGIADGISAFIETLSSVLSGGDFQALYDLINVGLIGGILFLLKKFIDEGIKIDLSGGLFDTLNQTFGELTGVLKSMQTSIKADALLKIAGAVGILTASMLVLAMIDSAALTRALGAMTVGFGNLIAVMLIMDKLKVVNAGSMIGMAFAMTGMATAMLILAGAVAAFGSMDLDELAKGLGSIMVILTGIVVFAHFIKANAAALAEAGGSLVPFSIGIILLARAVQKFSEFNPVELAIGLAGLSGALIAVTTALRLMPPNMISIGVGMAVFATGLLILARAVGAFANLSLWELAKGLTAIAVAMEILVVALNAMPASTMVKTGLGLIAVGVGLRFIAGAVAKMSELSVGELIKGLTGIAGALAILAVGLNVMTGTVGGAAAVLVAAVALRLMAGVIKEFAKIKIGDMVKALLGIVAVFAVLAVSASVLAPVIPLMLALGAAVLVLGAGFALLGAAAYLIAEALATLASIGPAALENMLNVIRAFVAELPAFLAGVAQGILAFIQVFLDAAPELVKALVAILGQLLDGILTLLPKVQAIITTFIGGVIEAIRINIPKLIQAGIEIILALLNGIQQNIGEIVTLAVSIIVNFLDALAENLPKIIEAGVNLLVSFLNGISENLDKVATAVSDLITRFIEEVVALYADIVAAGLGALTEFINGITENLDDLAAAAGSMIASLIEYIGREAIKMANAATTVIVKFIEGIGKNLSKIIKAGVDTVIAFIEGLGKNAVRLANAAMDVLIDFINGLRRAIDAKGPELRDAGWKLAGAIINGLTAGLAAKAGSVVSAIGNVVGGAIDAGKKILGINSPSKVTYGWGLSMIEGLNMALGDDRTVKASVDAFASNFVTALDLSMMEHHPVVTPILDLSVLQQDVKKIDTLVPINVGTYQVASDVSASLLAASESIGLESVSTSGLVFNQTINAPTQLSTSEIYRQTRTQLALAKEELQIR